jgi:hypothetical protein
MTFTEQPSTMRQGSSDLGKVSAQKESYQLLAGQYKDPYYGSGNSRHRIPRSPGWASVPDPSLLFDLPANGLTRKEGSFVNSFLELFLDRSESVF